jgi:nicotinamidase-related amidase
MATGWLSFLIFGDMAGNCKVLYVSQAEISELEKARMEREKSQSMFYGQIDKTIEYIQEETARYRDKRHKVILTTDKHPGGGVESISREVYKGVINRLKVSEEASGSTSRNTVVDP